MLTRAHAQTLATMRRRRRAALARELDAINARWMQSEWMPTYERDARARDAEHRHGLAAYLEERALRDAAPRLANAK